MKFAGDYSIAPLEKLLPHLDGVQSRGNQYRAICPAHESRNRSRSLSLKETDDGGVLLHCFAGCSPVEILGAIGLDLRDLFPADHTHSRPRRPYTKRQAFRARDALQLLAFEITVAEAFIGDVIEHRPVTKEGWNRLTAARDRISKIAAEYRL